MLSNIVLTTIYYMKMNISVLQQIKYFKILLLLVGTKTNKPRHIALRGINQDFKGDATGSDKRYSFCIESSNPDCDTVHVNEAPIDVLSQATLFELDNKEFNHEHILSLTGIYAPRNDTKEIKIPLALQQFLANHLKVKNIVFIWI